MSLTLAEVTGWYMPNYTKAENLFWGKGKGCNFLTGSCLSGKPPAAVSSEFCSSTVQQGCNFEYTGAGVCFTGTGTQSNIYWDYFGNGTMSTDSFADNCPSVSAYSNRVCAPGGMAMGYSPEYFGANSGCFVSSVVPNNYGLMTMGQCYQYQCVAQAAGGYQLKVIMGTESFTCTSAGQTLATAQSSYHGSITCPDPNNFCNIKLNSCSRNCAAGSCVNGTCVCPNGKVGPDCLRYAVVQNDPKCACSFPAVNSYNGRCVCPNNNCTATAPTASQCSACIPYCASCSNVSTCSSCQTGYYLSSGKCTSCSASIAGCTSCTSGSTCTQCSSSYTLSGGVCNAKVTA